MLIGSTRRPAEGEETRRYWNERHATATWNDDPAAWLLQHSRHPGRTFAAAGYVDAVTIRLWPRGCV